MSGIARSYGNSVFNFSRTCQTVFQNGYTILHSCQQCLKVPVSPHPCWHLLLSVFLTVAILMDMTERLNNNYILMDVKWCPNVVFVCIS